MGLFDRIRNKKQETVYADTDIISVGAGEIIPVVSVSDPMFAEQMMGPTVAYRLKDKTVKSPANGTIEVMFPTGHAFAVRMKDGTGLLIHIGIDTVNLKGKGFKVLMKQGDAVKAGQPVVQVGWDVIRNAGYNTETMMIITETPDKNKEWKFAKPGPVEDGQIVAE